MLEHYPFSFTFSSEIRFHMEWTTDRVLWNRQHSVEYTVFMTWLSSIRVQTVPHTTSLCTTTTIAKCPHLHREHEDSNHTSALHRTSELKPCDQSTTCWCTRFSSPLFHRSLRYCRDNTAHEQLATPRPPVPPWNQAEPIAPFQLTSGISIPGKTDKILALLHFLKKTNHHWYNSIRSHGLRALMLTNRPSRCVRNKHPKQ